MSDPSDMSRSAKIWRLESGEMRASDDEIAREEPLEIRVRGRAVSVTMRTPGNDEELAAGLLLSEGMVKSAGDILKIEPCGGNEEGNLVNVLLGPLVAVDFERLTRHVFASSSCGLCGKATIDAVRGQFPKLQSELTVKAEALLGMPAAMREAQKTFSRTGGLHAAGLFSAAGELI